MRYLIYILPIVILFSCSAGEMNADYAKMAPEPQAEFSEERDLSSKELEEYISIKLQDIMELQSLLFDPEIDKEMKAYAKDMILKIIPEERLLKEEYQIKQYTLETNEIVGNAKTIPASITLEIPNNQLQVEVQTSANKGGLEIIYNVLD